MAVNHIFVTVDDKTLCLNFLVKMTLFHFIFVASESDFLVTKLCMLISKDVLLTEPCNLHEL